MAKTIVVKEPEGDRSPFLRGILVQSLVNAGMEFAAAYDLAQTVRDELQDTREITSTALRARVMELLDERFGEERRQAYEARYTTDPGIIVHTPTRSVPFSIGIMSHSLETCAIQPEMALQGARKIYASLKKIGHKEIDHKSLRRVIYRCLTEHCSRDIADKYLSWRRFENSGESLILLIGGVTGSGKSTVSSELAYRMNISHIQSTDMMREIIRSYLTPQVVPTLGYSSFEAWRGLPVPAEGLDLEIENPVITGFLSQLSAMKPALESTIERAIHERQHLILEGVHVVPTEHNVITHDSHAVVVPLMLATMEKGLLSKQLKRRGREERERQASRYLEHLDAIWELQSWLLSEADKAGITIIQNWYIEDTVREILELAIRRIMERYPPQPDTGVWGNSH
jgi:2-phosphoglycerate kinase